MNKEKMLFFQEKLFLKTSLWKEDLKLLTKLKLEMLEKLLLKISLILVYLLISTVLTVLSILQTFLGEELITLAKSVNLIKKLMFKFLILIMIKKEFLRVLNNLHLILGKVSKLNILKEIKLPVKLSA